MGWDGTKKIVPWDEISRAVPWDATDIENLRPMIRELQTDVFLSPSPDPGPTKPKISNPDPGPTKSKISDLSPGPGPDLDSVEFTPEFFFSLISVTLST